MRRAAQPLCRRLALRPAPVATCDCPSLGAVLACCCAPETRHTHSCNVRHTARSFRRHVLTRASTLYLLSTPRQSKPIVPVGAYVRVCAAAPLFMQSRDRRAYLHSSALVYLSKQGNIA